MSMEFVMGNSLETLPKTIDFNFEELKGQLAESLALYTGLVVTEDGIKGAKEDRAKLNKLREALENKRKEVKRECMAPYTDFEAKVKELVGLIDQPIAAIDVQLKEYEEKRRADKRAAILEIYEETVGELRALLPFEKLWQDTWYNTSVTMKRSGRTSSWRRTRPRPIWRSWLPWRASLPRPLRSSTWSTWT